MARAKKVIKNPFLLVLVFIVVVCALLVLAWILAKEIYLDGNKITRENSQNVVINNVDAPADLVDTLLAEKSGCVEHLKKKNIDYIVRVKDGFALVSYGCSIDANMFYKKEKGKWIAISPTNQFINGVPLCSHLKENKIPKDVQQVCYDGALDASGKMPSLIVNPS